MSDSAAPFIPKIRQSSLAALKVACDRAADAPVAKVYVWVLTVDEGGDGHATACDACDSHRLTRLHYASRDSAAAKAEVEMAGWGAGKWVHTNIGDLCDLWENNVGVLISLDRVEVQS